jgi:uncharacterized protein YbjT (DUF2867 family)
VQRILVLGGTGLLGRPVTERLQHDGFEVRLLARDPDKARDLIGSGYEFTAGDVADVGALEQAMTGRQGVHISVGGAVDLVSAQNVAAVAEGIGVERISYLSGSTVDEQNRWFPMVAQKLDAETAIAASGVPYTVFCPTWPMEQLPRFVQNGMALVIGDRLPALHWFAAADLARMVSQSYQTADAANRRLYVHGPEAWTMAEAVERYCAALHPEIDDVAVIPVETARAQAAATGDQTLGFMAEMMAYFDQAGELGSPEEANRILGPPATTLDDWIHARNAK